MKSKGEPPSTCEECGRGASPWYLVGDGRVVCEECAEDVEVEA
jgi:formylmethanofuran dehydrogenase subunit E